MTVATSTRNPFRAQDAWAAANGLRPSRARRCPRVAAGLRCIAVYGINYCVCEDGVFQDYCDHARMWLDADGRHVLTTEPYRKDNVLANLEDLLAPLGLDVTFHADSPWNPGSTVLITIAHALREPQFDADMRKRDADRALFQAVDRILGDRLDGHHGGFIRHGRRPPSVRWKVPTPPCGHITVEVTIRPRWCSVYVCHVGAPWTKRVKEPAETWLRGNVWPHTAIGPRPYGGGFDAWAQRLERSKLLDVIEPWIRQELTWGDPSSLRDRPGL